MKRAALQAKKQQEARERQAAYASLTPEEKVIKDEAVKAKLAKQQTS